MRILIVDDERHIRESLKKYLSLEHIDAEGAESGEAAMGFLEREAFDAVVLDLKLPGISGQAVLEWIRDQGLSVPVIMISAHGRIADAVDALKTGARDYLVKPFDPAELVIKLRGLVENKRRENRIEAEERTAGPEQDLGGTTAGMKRIAAQIRKIAPTDVTVLITGESGTGKEVAAREIHLRGPWSAEPFVAVNIGGIHEGLMESELFGHEKGAFTGAAARRLGLFELAGRGTIFLDEIGEIPLPLQVKLLRVLQERKIRRLGGSADIPVNARIISATNRDLEALVREGRFREDLYYRLNVFRIVLPPLRERRPDIPLLAERLLAKLAARMGRTGLVLSPGAEEQLLGYSFPGNIRELENILERALIYGEGNVIRREDIDLRRSPADKTPPPAALPPPETAPRPEPGTAAAGAARPEARDLTAVEKAAIRDALARNGGNRTRAAAELGISRKTILNKIKAYGL
ncbi:MAG: sigma-54 dependent transcriptional regulator [Spirochaetaceae bacterium]|jgi:two-component system response regulator AtoC|nr:sigma-54 dependent transcriptional regulator [Spirochaetaceae bacterium]